MTDRVRIVEVGPRDGLQNEARALTADERVTLIHRLGDAGLTEIEAGAMVSPSRIPQMSGSDAVLSRLTHDGGRRYPVLVPNLKGLDAALAAGARDIAVFGAASETFSQRNIQCGIEESLRRFEPVVARARDLGLRVRGYVSCVAGCPYEGAIAPGKVADVAHALYLMGCEEISLGDTIGIGTPSSILAMLDAVGRRVPMRHLAGHYHDTRGMALANIFASLQAGVRCFDASVGGLGGCPYADGASGNVATEEVVYLLHGMGYQTGIDLKALVRTAWWACGLLGTEPASKLAHALKNAHAAKEAS
ncbi:MAG: hydroxymethylglutaryl-CoA lyase [Paludibacterium sp.]|uniref:hydroxymethylglutaryl-CoA lyase n=1 Tax=Paludibacterium sp. TaxID=1917523 RepID=UPI0025CF4F23|nr:hydroxymethylglutaryl-CoA lyase [Paludibacterium sp.]MBV8047275.1 hydroxymethylglutaryl-CoA lyase [Paludibacterium sp.]MBV8647279.1 hydroxymethylglutaryl-CoA lyase [Paludibacterium sp.]